MKSRPNVRGKGRKDREIAALKQQVADLEATVTSLREFITKQETVLDEAIEKIKVLTAAKTAAKAAGIDSEESPEKTPDQPEVSQRAIGAATRRLYLEEGGADLDRCLRNCVAKSRAFESQVDASESTYGSYVEGPKGWGPTITPYEDRMNNAQIIRLRKEIRLEMDRCREIVKQVLLEGRELSEVADPVYGESAGESADERRQAPALPPEPVIEFEVTDELVAEWVKWQTTRGAHKPPHLEPVMAALQRTDHGGYPLPDKVAELMQQVVTTIEAEMQAEQELTAQSAPARQSPGEGEKAGVEPASSQEPD